MDTAKRLLQAPSVAARQINIKLSFRYYETIEDTKGAREHLRLPHHFIVLYNHQDGGGILLDTENDQQSNERKVYNIGWESVPDSIADEIVFPSYFAYVQDQLRLKRDFIDPEHVDYNPDDYAFD